MKITHRLIHGVVFSLTLWGCVATPHQSAPVRVEAGPPLAWGAGIGGRIARSSSGYYQVKAADTLWAIAMVHDLDVEDLARWNNIRDADVIVVGQPLRLTPGDGRSPPVRDEVVAGAGAPAVQKGFSSFSGETAGNNTPRVGEGGGPVLAPVGVETISLAAPAGETVVGEVKSEAPVWVEPTARPLAKPVAERHEPEKAATASEGGSKGADVAKSAEYAGILKAPSPRGWRWPARGKILQKFGQFGQQRYNGIDIAVAEGAPVEAAAAGIVAYADDGLSSYGNLILVRHGGSYMSAYAHNSAILVKPGEKVAAGQVIAKAGQTGGASSPKLHFELRKGIEPVDPLHYLPKNN